MAESGSGKGQMDEGNYSSPVPVIGLYIAGANLVCFLLIFFDMLTGLRHRKRWLPCRLFSLNSITLTLLSVVTKLPVDLTTPMPTVHDQLSKLTGTTMLCICMGFLMPSLGTMRFSECLTNMGALSILAVTILVNISIQMNTGVIFMFHVEHIIILCCMMLLLIVLWFCAFEINSIKEISIDRNKSIFLKGQDSLFQRLKLCYLYGFDSNPQFTLCKHPNCIVIFSICLVSLVVLIQAAFRSFFLNDLESREGVSDYKWSIWSIVVIQIVIILLGSFGNSFRITLAHHIDLYWLGSFEDDELNTALLNNPILMEDGQYIWLTIWLKLPSMILVFCMQILFYSIFDLLKRTYHIMMELLCSNFKSKDRDDNGAISEFKDLIGTDGDPLEEWSIKKGVEDMNRWIKKNETDVLHHLIQLLTKTPPSQESLVHQLKYQSNANEGYEITSLTMVLLVKISVACLPSSLTNPLTETLDEVFEVIHFIDNEMNFMSFKNRKKCKVSKAAWMSDGFTEFMPNIMALANAAPQSHSELDKALEIIRLLEEVVPYDFIRDELCIITNFIKHQVYESLDDLYSLIEQLFMDMLDAFLTRLPNVIFKEIMESDPEDFEERTKSSVKVLCKVGSLDNHVRWSFPAGSNISYLMTNTAPNADNGSNTQLDCNIAATNTPHAIEDASNIVR